MKFKVYFCQIVIGLPLSLFAVSIQCDSRPAEPPQSTSVESIPEVLEDKESSTEQSDTASVHDIDYVNPRGVRFTQSTQRDGESPFFPIPFIALLTSTLFFEHTLEILEYAVSLKLN